MITSSRIDSIICKFCQIPVEIENGQLGKLNKHMEYCHDMYYDKDFAKILNLLNKSEVKFIIQKLAERVQKLIQLGTFDLDENLFENSVFGVQDNFNHESSPFENEAMETSNNTGDVVVAVVVVVFIFIAIVVISSS